MKAMKKKMYVSPETEMKTVELENGFMSGSANIQNPNDESTGQIEEHQKNNDFSVGFGAQEWTIEE